MIVVTLLGLLLVSMPALQVSEATGVTEQETEIIAGHVRSALERETGSGTEEVAPPVSLRLRRVSWKIEVELSTPSAGTRVEAVVVLTRQPAVWGTLLHGGVVRLLEQVVRPAHKPPRTTTARAPPPPPPVPPLLPPALPERSGVGVAPWIVLGVSAALATVGTLFAVRTAETLAELPTPSEGRALSIGEATRLKEGQEEAFRTGVAANLMLSVGAAGLITSTVLLAVD